MILLKNFYLILASSYRARSKKSRKKLVCNLSLLALIFVVINMLMWALLRGNYNESSFTNNNVTTTSTTETPNYGLIVPREAWNAIPPLSAPISIPSAILAIIKHTGGSTCLNFKSCNQRLKEIQLEHMEVLKYPDIAYNFLVGGDGQIYEGRGWRVKNEGRNDSMDLAFIGNFNEEMPSKSMFFDVHEFLVMSATQGALNYELYYEICHNQTEPTDSPGEYLFKAVVEGFEVFKHYTSNICYKNSTQGIKIDYDCTFK